MFASGSSKKEGAGDDQKVCLCLQPKMLGSTRQFMPNCRLVSLGQRFVYHQVRGLCMIRSEVCVSLGQRFVSQQVRGLCIIRSEVCVSLGQSCVTHQVRGLCIIRSERCVTISGNILLYSYLRKSIRSSAIITVLCPYSFSIEQAQWYSLLFLPVISKTARKTIC